MPCASNIVTCIHVRVNGIRCGSPALRGEQFCYFHQRMFRGVPTPPNSRLHPIALLESDEAIQASLMEVVNALARNTIDLKRAELILKALYIAVKNSRRSRFDIWETRMIREVPDFPTPPDPAPPALAEPIATLPIEPATPAQIETASPEATALLDNLERVLKGDKPQPTNPANTPAHGPTRKVLQSHRHRAPSG